MKSGELSIQSSSSTEKKVRAPIIPAFPYQCRELASQSPHGLAEFFFPCIAVLVRDIVGQPLERAKKENKFPRKQKPTRTNTPTKQNTTTKPNQAKIQGNFANKVKQVKRPRPSQAPHKFSSAK